MMMWIDLGNIEDVVGFDDYIEKRLAEKQKIIDEQQSTIQRFEEYVFSDERIICYTCLFCQEKDIYEVKCEIKGSVDVHGRCQYYEKKGGDGV